MYNFVSFIMLNAVPATVGCCIMRPLRSCGMCASVCWHVACCGALKHLPAEIWIVGGRSVTDCQLAARSCTLAHTAYVHTYLHTYICVCMSYACIEAAAVGRQTLFVKLSENLM